MLVCDGKSFVFIDFCSKNINNGACIFIFRFDCLTLQRRIFGAASAMKFTSIAES